jgi:protein arginine kinase activator
MQFCTACQKAPATIVIMDLSGGSVTGQQQLCAACAENMGIVQKPTSKISPEILEDLLGGLKGKGPRESAKRRETACPGCGLTPQDFKIKGRLGCPRCYEAFRGELVPLLQRVHEAATHRGRLPGRAAAAVPTVDPDNLADLRRRLEDAVRKERYEEAAKLRDDLRKIERGETEARP